ncbi:heavy metal sensor histidine kinase [Achromobacter marplatensis]|uniref:Sensor protein n=2 Tax=Achromobacter marplatensis TaxID=470868 RepID=A0AA42WFI7_9BURK|nr:heavy metal sensor histidine kinase [Achromobacter marplatensis]MDH2054225.1 heavy metal sensor histidine kinase [Achromobacter marplatensis]
MRASISTRLALMFGLSVVLIVSVCAVLLHGSLKASLQQQMRNELELRHSLLDPLLMSRDSKASWAKVINKLNALAPDDGPDAQHWVVSEDPFYRYGVDAPRGVDWRAVPDGYSTLALDGDCRPLNVFVTTLPPVGSRPEVRFIVALDSTPYMETLGAFTSTLVGMSVAGTLFVALLGYFIARLGLFPVRRLSAQAHGLAPGNSGQRLRTEHLPSEIKDMAVSFNGVLERQEVAWRQLESFNADVAHELRTPLTNLVGQTQLGLAVGKDVHEFKELLQSNLEELERMTSIINDMLFLSHAQVGRMTMDLSDVSLREEAAKTTEYVEPLFGDKDLTVTLRGDARALIDRRLFHRALANLLENAAFYAKPGTDVAVAMQAQAGMAQVCVSNVGDPIDARSLPRLFERFFRVESARTQSDKHHGLGLSIVKAIASIHQGDVFVRSENGVNTFGFTMACRPAPGAH